MISVWRGRIEDPSIRGPPPAAWPAWSPVIRRVSVIVIVYVVT